MTDYHPKDNTWRTRAYEPGSLPDQVQKIAQRLEKAGLEIRSVESGEERMSWPELVQIFADVGDAVIDEHVRRQREKAEYMNAHSEPSESPEEAHEIGQAEPHGSMIIRFINGSEEIIHMHHPLISAHGWTFRQLQGIPYLVMGHAMNRRQYPLCNIAFIQLSPEEL